MYKKLNEILENFKIVPININRDDFLEIFNPHFSVNGVSLAGLIQNL